MSSPEPIERDQSGLNTYTVAPAHAASRRHNDGAAGDDLTSKSSFLNYHLV
jgi:hypothetical protein